MIVSKTAEVAGFSDEQLDVRHKPEEGGSRTEIEYRLAWTRTYLKKYGLLENSSRVVWAWTQKGQQVDRVNPIEVKCFVLDQSVKKDEDKIPDEEEAQPTLASRNSILSGLIKKMSVNLRLTNKPTICAVLMGCQLLLANEKNKDSIS